MATTYDTNNYLSPQFEKPSFPSFGDMKSLLMSPHAATRSAMEPAESLNLLNMTSLGEPDPHQISKHDLLSSIAFDKRGDFLSVGDRGGRVIIFEKKFEKGEEDFDYFTEFQSHTKAFDTLNSSDISEAVTSIEWLNNVNTMKPMMLTQNQKVVKLWRIQDKVTKKHESCKKMLQKGKGIVFPKTKTAVEGKTSKLVTSFKTGKEHHLHSLS